MSSGAVIGAMCINAVHVDTHTHTHIQRETKNKNLREMCDLTTCSLLLFAAAHYQNRTDDLIIFLALLW